MLGKVHLLQDTSENLAVDEYGWYGVLFSLAIILMFSSY